MSLFRYNKIRALRIGQRVIHPLRAQNVVRVTSGQIPQHANLSDVTLAKSNVAHAQIPTIIPGSLAGVEKNIDHSVTTNAYHRAHESLSKAMDASTDEKTRSILQDRINILNEKFMARCVSVDDVTNATAVVVNVSARTLASDKLFENWASILFKQDDDTIVRMVQALTSTTANRSSTAPVPKLKFIPLHLLLSLSNRALQIGIGNGELSRSHENIYTTTLRPSQSQGIGSKWEESNRAITSGLHLLAKSWKQYPNYLDIGVSAANGSTHQSLSNLFVTVHDLLVHENSLQYKNSKLSSGSPPASVAPRPFAFLGATSTHDSSLRSLDAIPLLTQGELENMTFSLRNEFLKRTGTWAVSGDKESAVQLLFTLTGARLRTLYEYSSVSPISRKRQGSSSTLSSATSLPDGSHKESLVSSPKALLSILRSTARNSHLVEATSPPTQESQSSAVKHFSLDMKSIQANPEKIAQAWNLVAAESAASILTHQSPAIAYEYLQQLLSFPVTSLETAQSALHGWQMLVTAIAEHERNLKRANAYFFSKGEKLGSEEESTRPKHAVPYAELPGYRQPDALLRAFLEWSQGQTALNAPALIPPGSSTGTSLHNQQYHVMDALVSSLRTRMSVLASELVNNPATAPPHSELSPLRVPDDEAVLQGGLRLSTVRQQRLKSRVRRLNDLLTYQEKYNGTSDQVSDVHKLLENLHWNKFGTYLMNKAYEEQLPLLGGAAPETRVTQHSKLSAVLPLTKESLKPSNLPSTITSLMEIERKEGTKSLPWFERAVLAKLKMRKKETDAIAPLINVANIVSTFSEINPERSIILREILNAIGEDPSAGNVCRLLPYMDDLVRLCETAKLSSTILSLAVDSGSDLAVKEVLSIFEQHRTPIASIWLEKLAAAHETQQKSLRQAGLRGTVGKNYSEKALVNSFLESPLSQGHSVLNFTSDEWKRVFNSAKLTSLPPSVESLGMGITHLLHSQQNAPSLGQILQSLEKWNTSEAVDVLDGDSTSHVDPLIPYDVPGAGYVLSKLHKQFLSQTLTNAPTARASHQNPVSAVLHSTFLPRLALSAATGEVKQAFYLADSLNLGLECVSTDLKEPLPLSRKVGVCLAGALLTAGHPDQAKGVLSWAQSSERDWNTAPAAHAGVGYSQNRLMHGRKVARETATPMDIWSSKEALCATYLKTGQMGNGGELLFALEKEADARKTISLAPKEVKQKYIMDPLPHSVSPYLYLDLISAMSASDNHEPLSLLRRMQARGMLRHFDAFLSRGILNTSGLPPSSLHIFLHDALMTLAKAVKHQVITVPKELRIFHHPAQRLSIRSTLQSMWPPLECSIAGIGGGNRHLVASTEQLTAFLTDPSQVEDDSENSYSSFASPGKKQPFMMTLHPKREKGQANNALSSLDPEVVEFFTEAKHYGRPYDRSSLAVMSFSGCPPTVSHLPLPLTLVEHEIQAQERLASQDNDDVGDNREHSTIHNRRVIDEMMSQIDDEDEDDAFDEFESSVATHSNSGRGEHHSETAWWEQEFDDSDSENAKGIEFEYDVETAPYPSPTQATRSAAQSQVKKHKRQESSSTAPISPRDMSLSSWQDVWSSSLESVRQRTAYRRGMAQKLRVKGRAKKEMLQVSQTARSSDEE